MVRLWAFDIRDIYLDTGYISTRDIYLDTTSEIRKRMVDGSICGAAFMENFRKPTSFA